MLKAVIIDASAMSRDLLSTVLIEGGYSVAGSVHTTAQGYALLQKHHPHFVCIGLDQIEDGSNIVEQIRENMPKTLIFMMSGTIDANMLQAAVSRGIHGFIVKPFKADAVLKTIKNAVLAMIKKQQQA
jgi:two-component system chemotaxis response regulator CheY